MIFGDGDFDDRQFAGEDEWLEAAYEDRFFSDDNEDDFL